MIGLAKIFIQSSYFAWSERDCPDAAVCLLSFLSVIILLFLIFLAKQNMAYTSYNAYIVQNNGALVLAIMIVNYLAFTFNIRPLIYLLEVRVIGAIGMKLTSLYKLDCN